MFNFVERLIAYRYLRTKRKEKFISLITIISLLGIMIGVATLIIVMSVMNGFRIELQDRILGLNGHFNVYQFNAPLAGYQDLSKQLEGLDTVKSVIPVIQSQLLISENGMNKGIIVRAYSYEGFAKKTLLNKSIVQGQVTEENFTGNQIVVGQRLATDMGISVGDQVTLISPKPKVTAFGSLPRQLRVSISAIFDVGMYEYDQNFIFMPLDTAQHFFDLPDAVSSLEIIVPNPDKLLEAQRQLYDFLPVEYRFTDWKSTSGFFDALEVERNVMFLILMLIIIVAALNIISSMVMLVKDKSKDIAILRTIGASRSAVMRIFVLTGSSIGVFGTLMGFLFGVLFVENIESIRQFVQFVIGRELFSAEIYYLTQLPAVLEWSEVIKILIAALSISILATIYPAYRASRLDPVEVLRYE